jgi:cytochrome c oxidase subunit 1
MDQSVNSGAQTGGVQITHDGHQVEHNGHGHHHHKQSFLTTYVFSQDHKMIAKQFLATGMAWAVIGGLFSVLFRLQLGYPDQTFPILETFLGRWAKGGQIQPDFYYALVTMHGTILVFFVLTGGLSGTFANLLIPLQVGARDMASPFMNMLSYWFFFLASIVMFGSLFIETGPASGGWTSYPPLSALHQANIGSALGMDLWILSMALFVVSSLLGGLNYISTILNMRTKGMSMTRMPLTIWALFFTAILGVLSFPVLLSGFILLLFDRNLGTSFYLSDIVVNGQILPNEGGSAILYQHLFWFLGHPEVYIIILPAFGLVSEVMSVNARKPIFGYMAMVGSLFAITILAFLVWAHHMFVSGMNPFLGAFFVLLTLLIAIPSAIKVFNWLTTLWRGNLRFTPGHAVCHRLCKHVYLRRINRHFPGQLHHRHPCNGYLFRSGALSYRDGRVGVLWHVCRRIPLVPENVWPLPEQYPGLHPLLGNAVGAYLIFWPMHYQGLANVPRRYYDFSLWQSFKQFNDLNKFITVFL